MITFALSHIKSTIQCNLTHKGDVWFVYGRNPWPHHGANITPGAFIVPTNMATGRLILKRKRAGDLSYTYKNDDITIELQKDRFVYVGGKIHDAYHITFEAHR
jgi:hypothetical protein